MSSIIIALPRLEDAKYINNALKRRGLEATAICTTASNVLSQVHQLDSGIVICSSRLPDMYYVQLAECMTEFFEILLLGSTATLETCPPGILTLQMPFKPGDLIGTVEMILQKQVRRLKKLKAAPPKRSEQEQNYINNAKWVLMERNNMTEKEAFRYIQKCSMDSGTNMVETAQMILLMICNE